jgi:hypothetical protein
MEIKRVIELLDGSVFTPDVYNENKDIVYGFSCDLMSDVLMILRNSNNEINEAGMLITGLVTKQAIRTAEMLDLDTILFVRGKKPAEELVELATENEITLIGTDLVMYTCNGILFQNGIFGIERMGAE